MGRVTQKYSRNSPKRLKFHRIQRTYIKLSAKELELIRSAIMLIGPKKTKDIIRATVHKEHALPARTFTLKTSYSFARAVIALYAIADRRLVWSLATGQQIEAWERLLRARKALMGRPSDTI